MTQAFWTTFWWWWLWVILGAFSVPEAASILLRRALFGTKLTDWTLSDTIRRWSRVHHWLPALVSGGLTLLAVHWFWSPP